MAKKYVDEFYLYNIKSIKALEGKVHGKHFALVGPNRGGKSTVFQMIHRLIGAFAEAKDNDPRQQMQKPEVWLNRDAEKGEILLKLVANGDVYWVSEKMTSTTRSRIRLWREEADGRRVELTPSQTRLQEIFGNVLDLTPLMSMSGVDQFKYLQKRLDIDVTGYETNKETLNAGKTKIKGKVSLLSAMISEQKVTDDDIKTYAEEKDVELLQKKKFVLRPLEVQVEADEAQLKISKGHIDRVVEIDAQIKKLQEEKLRLEADIILAAGLPKKLAADRKALEDAKQVNAEIDEEIRTASEHNMAHNRVVYVQEKSLELEAAIKEFKEQEAKITELDKAFRAMLVAIPFDKIYKGLSLEYQPKDKENKIEEKIGLYLDGLPLVRSQESYSTFIKVLINMAVQFNPDGLNFVYIDHWESFDDNSKQELLDFTNSHENVQLGVEKVNNNTVISVEFIEVKEKEKKPKRAAPKKK